MSTSKLSGLEVKLGIIQVVVVIGVITGAMVCAFAFGFFSGESVGYERALTTSLSSTARIPIAAERKAEDVNEHASEIYAKLNDTSALAGKPGDGQTNEEVPELGAIRSADVNAGVPDDGAPLQGNTRAGDKKDAKARDAKKSESLGMGVLSGAGRDATEETPPAGVSVLGRSHAAQSAAVSGAAVSGVGTLGGLLESPGGKEIKAAAEESGQTAGAATAAEVVKAVASAAKEPAAAERAALDRSAPVSAKLAGSAAAKEQKAKAADETAPPKQTPAQGQVPVKQNLSRGWYAQISAPQRLEDANALAGKLKASGFPVVIEKAQVRGQQYFRIMAGPESSRGQAEQLVDQLGREKYLHGDPFIRVVK